MKDFDYIDYHRLPTCPAPWSSTDAGELWLSGDYFMTLQKYPLSMLALMENKDNEPVSPYEMAIVYPYALLVYHKIDEEYPKILPIIVITLETSNYGNESWQSIISELDQDDPKNAIFQTGKYPRFFCMFQNGVHYNFGPYLGSIDRDTIRGLFFDKLASLIPFAAPPKKLGNMAAGVGNPLTGLPAI